MHHCNDKTNKCNAFKSFFSYFEMLRATGSDLGAGVCMPYALLTHCFREKPTIRLSHVSDDNVAVCLGVQSFFYL